MELRLISASAVQIPRGERASIDRVNPAVHKTSARWRAFADAVALALGVNIWISVVVLPGLFVGSWRTSTDIAIASAPLLMLGFGIWRRSDTALLLLFPSALMVPIAMAPQMVATQVYGPVRFMVVAVGLVAYLFGVSFFSSFYEPDPPENSRNLASSRRPVPVRWRRRFRMYRSLAILSLVFPATLLYTANFDSTSKAFLEQMFPGRVPHMTTVVNLAALGLWVMLFIYAFLGVLRPHRTGDRILVADLGRMRADARRGKLKPSFYVGVLCSVGFMLLLLFGRYI